MEGARFVGEGVREGARGGTIVLRSDKLACVSGRGDGDGEWGLGGVVGGAVFFLSSEILVVGVVSQCLRRDRSGGGGDDDDGVSQRQLESVRRDADGLPRALVRAMQCTTFISVSRKLQLNTTYTLSHCNRPRFAGGVSPSPLQSEYSRLRLSRIKLALATVMWV